MRLFLFIPFLIAFLNCHDNPSLDKSTLPSPEIAGDTLQHKTAVAELDDAMRETSGLMLVGNEYWTINDSGNDPVLYNFDLTSGEVIKKLELQGVKNQDWESLANDDINIYVGDFGNNKGGRKNLTIYKSEITQLTNSSITNPQPLNFSYPDQDKYYSGYNHNFDCEALVSYGDSLYLFSKNWLDRKCKLYGLSKTGAEQTANLINEFDSRGTITGASLDKENQLLYLLGYNGIGVYTSFIWVISDWEGSDFFTGNKTRYELMIDRQTEGILVDTDGSLLISAESNRGGHPSLYRVPITQ